MNEPERSNPPTPAGATRVLIAGGGTGGHVIPALCVAESLKNRGVAVEFVGSRSGIETDLVPNAGYKLHALPLAGLAGNPLARARALVLFLRAVTACRRIIQKYRPGVVFGVGGYASAPAVVAARILGVPTFLHEQNSVPGLVNRVASRVVAETLVTFPEAARYVGRSSRVGMPTRREFFGAAKDEALEYLGLEPPVVFVFGGSGGALTLNLAAAEAFGESTPYSVVQIAGRRDFARLSTQNPRHRILDYVEDIWRYLAAADVVVSRAGAGSLFDLAAAGRAAILVPFPYATGDHQSHNARYFVENEAADLMPDHEVRAATLRARVEGLLGDGARRSGLARRMAELATPDASDDVADKLLEVAGRSKA